ncbi:hypothetical protein GZL_01134 [Streptomyces sp. 769]|nr:hypothetical protein GZL_01134 [Streptomyces sp. 769]
MADRITGAARSVESPVGHVLIPGCRRLDDSVGRSALPGAHLRTAAPSAHDRTAGPTTGPASPRPPRVDNNTRTSCLHFRRFAASADDSAP